MRRRRDRLKGVQLTFTVDYSERCPICGTLATVGCNCWEWFGCDARRQDKASKSGQQPASQKLSCK